MEIVINMGECIATKKPNKLVCHGLGPCIALFLYDRINGIGSGAHIMYPDDSPQELIKTKIAQYAFEQMLVDLKRIGANTKFLRAKIAGGASIYTKIKSNIGKRNIEKVKSLLLENSIFLAQADVGGNIGRSAIFDLSNGDLKVSSISKKFK